MNLGFCEKLEARQVLSEKEDKDEMTSIVWHHSHLPFFPHICIYTHIYICMYTYIIHILAYVLYMFYILAVLCGTAGESSSPD